MPSISNGSRSNITLRWFWPCFTSLPSFLRLWPSLLVSLEYRRHGTYLNLNVLFKKGYHAICDCATSTPMLSLWAFMWKSFGWHSCILRMSVPFTRLRGGSFRADIRLDNCKLADILVGLLVQPRVSTVNRARIPVALISARISSRISVLRISNNCEVWCGCPWLYGLIRHGHPPILQLSKRISARTVQPPWSNCP